MFSYHFTSPASPHLVHAFLVLLISSLVSSLYLVPELLYCLQWLPSPQPDLILLSSRKVSLTLQTIYCLISADFHEISFNYAHLSHLSIFFHFIFALPWEHYIICKKAPGYDFLQFCKCMEPQREQKRGLVPILDGLSLLLEI